MNQNTIFNEQASYDEVVQLDNPTFSEAWALVEAAQRMAKPFESGSLDDPENLGNLREAIQLNSELWSIFQTELQNESGVMPANLREDMLNLCGFVGMHSVDTLNEPTAERVMALIAINRQIADCLLESLQVAMDLAEAQTQEEPTDDSQDIPSVEPAASS